MVIGRLFGKDKGDSGNPDLPMAYLEEAQRLRSPMLLVDGKGREMPMHIQNIGEDRMAIQASGILPVERGDRFFVLLCMDSCRFRVKLRAIETRNGLLHVDLPIEIEIAERRRRPRARLNVKEGATATCLTGLFEGIGITGPIENIGEGGLRMRVEKAMEVKSERRLHSSMALIPMGTPFMLIKLSKLPKAPNLEVDGRVVGVQMDGNVLYLNIAFQGMHGALKSLVSSRSSAPPTSVPMKQRRWKDPKEKEREKEREPAKEANGDGNGKPAAAEAAPPAEAAAPPPPAPPAEVAPEAVAVAAPPAAERPSALNALRKRTRAILVAMEDHPDREWLRAFLLEQGYQRIHLAGTLTQVLEALDQPGLSLIFIDGGVAELKGVELADFLKNRLGEGKPPVILAQETIQTVLVLAARRAGVDEILVKPYDHDETLAGKIEGLLGLS